MEWEIEMMSLNHLRSVRVGAHDRQSGRNHLLHWRQGQERCPVNDQRVNRVAGWAEDSVVVWGPGARVARLQPEAQCQVALFRLKAEATHAEL